VLPIFPTPYPDELLYSVIARYHRWSGNPSQKETVKDMFADGYPCAVVDLPNRLNAIAAGIIGNTKFTPDYIIQWHTLFPIYRAFLPRVRAEQIREYMLYDTEGGKIHSSVGVMASTISVPRLLRYCRHCAREEIERSGEAYWHREHQIPGVCFCLEHNCPLNESQVVIPSQASKHRFEELSKAICESGKELKLEPKHMSHYIRLIESMRWLLSSNVSIKSLDDLRNRYLGYLYSKDLATYSGRIRMRDLEKAFVEYYSPGFLNAVQCQVDPGTDHWLCRMVRKPKTSHHPLRHVLLIGFLGLTMEDFYTEYPVPITPFGRGPWPCLNRAANHYHKSVVKKCIVTRDYKTGAPVGTFKCSCGFVYSRRGPDLNENDRYRIGRIKEFGEVWLKKLQDLTELKDIGLRATARELGVDPNTVIRQQALLNTPDSQQLLKDPINGELLQLYRGQWESAREGNPGLSKTEIRNLFPGVYVWLYRHDRVWLDENSPKKSDTVHQDYRRIDWEQRDYEMEQAVLSSVERIRAENKRVTKTAIGRELKRPSWIEKHLDKLPRTKAAIEHESESCEDFQIRRVYRVAAVYKSTGYTLKNWQLVRKAGLRADYSALVNHHIENAISDNQQWLM